jgi:CubicO group peptidase (beta-lactamase class C family)
VSVAAIAAGRIEWAEGWGVTDAQDGTPVTADTLFQAGSMSKPVAALCALRLVADGKVELDAPVAPRLRTWRGPDDAQWHAVTLRQLLTHTAGLTVHGFDGYPRDTAPPSVVDVLEGRGNSAPVVFDAAPGERYSYAGGGYVVMQQLLADVSGLSFPDLAARMVFGPLGMTDSSFEQPLPEDRWVRAASGHLRGGEPVAGKWHVYPEMAAGGLWSTVTDLARFLIAIRDARNGAAEAILPAELAREMVTQQAPDFPIGLGLHLDGALAPYRGRPEGLRFGHGGDTQGFLGYMEIDADGGRGAVVMTNSSWLSDTPIPSGLLIAAILESLARV